MPDRTHELYRVSRWAAVTCGFLFGLLLPATLSAQVEGLFDTKTLEASIERQFRLSRNDMKVLRPMIKRESEVMVLIFGDCEDRAEDYMGLWNKVRASRAEFESMPRNGLTPRQQRTLRAIRFEFELIVLDQWREDFVQQLTDYLELTWIQSNVVAKVFEVEQHKRLKLLTGKSMDVRNIDSKWRELTVIREKSLEMILDPQQLRDYLWLTKRIEPLIG